jgi:hypothetical protein
MPLGSGLFIALKTASEYIIVRTATGNKMDAFSGAGI